MWKKLEADKRLFYQSIGIKVFILCIPFLIFFVFTQLVITEQTKNAKSSLVLQLESKTVALQMSVDEYVERCQAISYVLSQNQNLYYLWNKAEGNIENSAENIYYVKSEIKSICLTNNFVADIVICISKTDININKEERLTIEDIYQNYIHEEGVDYSLQEWYADSMKFTGGKLQVLENGSVYFFKTYPITPRGTTNKWSMLIKMNNTVGLQKFKSTGAYKGTIMTIIEDGTNTDICDESGEVLWTAEELPLEGESATLKKDGYLISYQKSEQLNVTYLAVTKDETLVRQEAMQHGIVVFVFVGCVLLGGILIVIQTKKEMNPIKQLLAMIDGDSGSSTSLWDPYSEIKSKLLESADQKLAQMNAQLHTKRNDMRKTLIAVLYDKKSSMELIDKHVIQAEILYKGNLSCFIKIKCVDSSSFFEDIKEEANQEANQEDTPIQFCATIVSQILREKNEIITITHGQEAFLIGLYEEKYVEFAFREMKNQLQQIQRLLQERYGMETLVAVSNLHSNISGIEAGFKECNQVIEYLEFSGNKNFEEYGVFSILQKQKEAIPAYTKDIKQLTTAIKAGELEQAEESFERIVGTYFSDIHVFNGISKFRVYALAGNMLEAFDSLARMQSEAWLQEWYENHRIFSFHNILEFKENTIDLFGYVKEITKKSVEKNKNYIVKSITDIIVENYMNPDLNVSMVASLLNKNLDYISRAYKKSTGNGILECIQDYRIEKAKTYLAENPELTIQKVASMVGYVNCESFIRTFKHKQGVTPGRYKSMAKKHE